MKTVGAFDAKTHLNQLLERASKSESLAGGIPAAKLVPPDFGEKVESRISELRKLRKGITLGKATIRQLIDEGRLI